MKLAKFWEKNGQEPLENFGNSVKKDGNSFMRKLRVGKHQNIRGIKVIFCPNIQDSTTFLYLAEPNYTKYTSSPLYVQYLGILVNTQCAALLYMI